MSLIDPSQAFGPSTEPMLSFLQDEALPIGTVLGGCQIMEPISVDGASILYLATDSALQRSVLIREHFPAQWVQRENQTQVSLRAGADELARAQALEAFLKEARLLGKLDHLSIAKVHRFWEQNQTAYMMMPFYQGETLASFFQRTTASVTEVWLRQLLGALLGALKVLHQTGCYHLAMSPENIWVTPEGQPILLDLSGSNQVLGERLHASNNLDRSYSPIEQFSHGASLRLGPWTDLYTLAAIVYQALTGHPPTPAAILGFDDQLAPLAETLLDKNPREPQIDYSLGFLASIDKALSVLPENRPQTAAEFELSLASSAPAASLAHDMSEQVGLPDPIRADPAAEAAIAMAISSLPWVAQKEAPQDAPPQETFFDSSYVPTEPVFVRPRSSPTLTPQAQQLAQPQPVQKSAAPPRAVPIAAAAARQFDPVFKHAPERQVEPAFKPAAMPPASTFEEQWIQPPLVGTRSVRSAALAPRASKKGWWVGVWLAIFSAVGWGVYATQNGNFASAGGQAQTDKPVLQAKTSVNAASAPALASTQPATLDKPEIAVAIPAPALVLPSPVLAASAPASVKPPPAPLLANKPPQPTRAEIQTEKAQRAERLRAQNKLAQEAKKSAKVAEKEAAKKAAKEAAKAREAELAARKQAAAAKAQAVSTPKGVCSGRANFSLVYCMQTQCARPAFTRHPQCVAFRIDGEVR